MAERNKSNRDADPPEGEQPPGGTAGGPVEGLPEEPPAEPPRELTEPVGGPEADFIAKIVGDPTNPPDTILLTGFLGRSSEPDYTRLYFDAELSDYVEIPNDAILFVQPLAAEGSALAGSSYVWIQSDAELIHGKAGPNRQRARFFEGRIAQDYLGGAAGGGGGGGGGGGQGEDPQTNMPGCPSTSTCPPTSGYGCPSTSTCPPQTHMLGCPPTSTCPPTSGYGCPRTSTCPPTSAPGCPGTSTCPQQGFEAGSSPTGSCTPETHMLGCPSTSTCPPQTHLLGCPPTSTCPPQQTHLLG
ncbi:MAG TPA: hypothetical protein VFG99_00525, partial [Chloroflexia bacterium]|nr:hypothetical protein [Chloroflexia bacterium]